MDVGYGVRTYGIYESEIKFEFDWCYGLYSTIMKQYIYIYTYICYSLFDNQLIDQ